MKSTPIQVLDPIDVLPALQPKLSTGQVRRSKYTPLYRAMLKHPGRFIPVPVKSKAQASRVQSAALRMFGPKSTESHIRELDGQKVVCLKLRTAPAAELPELVDLAL